MHVTCRQLRFLKFAMPNLTTGFELKTALSFTGLGTKAVSLLPVGLEVHVEELFTALPQAAATKTIKSPHRRTKKRASPVTATAAHPPATPSTDARKRSRISVASDDLARSAVHDTHLFAATAISH